MARLSIFFFFLLTAAMPLNAQRPEIIHFPDLENRIHSQNDTLYVVNFWATWCKPCVAELPFFEKLNDSHSGQPVKVLLVSMDFMSDYEKRLVPFLKKRNMDSEVVMLDEPKHHLWIDKVHSSWSGAIPATIFLRHSDSLNFFKEGEFTETELFQIVVNNLKNKP